MFVFSPTQAKIQENEKLHAQIADEELNNKGRISDLESNIVQLKRELKTYREKLDSLKQSKKVSLIKIFA